MSCSTKPLDVNRWGHTAVWNLLEAAYILTKLEPDAQMNVLDADAEIICDQLARAASIGFPSPFKGPGNLPLFLPIEVIAWYEKIGQGVDPALKAAVTESTKAFVDHQRRARQASASGAEQHRLSPATLRALERFGPAKATTTPSSQLSSAQETVNPAPGLTAPLPPSLPNTRVDGPQPLRSPIVKNGRRLVEWRRSIVSNWPDIVAAHGSQPSGRNIVKHLREHDIEGCIQPKIPPNEKFGLVWIGLDKQERIVTYKTIINAVAELRLSNLIPNPKKNPA